MCCFSGPVKHVAETSIFCRMGARGNQVVIYSMVLEAEQDLAMVLPVPVAEQRDEDSVSFIDLSLSPDFWVRMGWQESVALAAGYVNATRLRGSVLGDRHVYKRQIVGEFENADVSVAAV